eukprot:GFYU01028037.1.p1 GENE.GFYU01028037.1~~GFYU01028037.1.p1  ORF type:complete len:397 (-),score=103.79 GFYU01028037.1:216-1406(-)
MLSKQEIDKCLEDSTDVSTLPPNIIGYDGCTTARSWRRAAAICEAANKDFANKNWKKASRKMLEAVLLDERGLTINPSDIPQWLEGLTSPGDGEPSRLLPIWFLMMAEKYAEAAKDLEKLIEMVKADRGGNPVLVKNLSRLFELLAGARMFSGDSRGTTKALQDALEHKPSAKVALTVCNNLATMEFNNNNFEKCREIVTKSFTACDWEYDNKGSCHAYCLLAVTSFFLKDDENVRSKYFSLAMRSKCRERFLYGDSSPSSIENYAVKAFTTGKVAKSYFKGFEKVYAALKKDTPSEEYVNEVFANIRFQDVDKDRCFCQWCGVAPSDLPDCTDKLKGCAKCASVYYCKRECQVNDWKRWHKSACGALAAARAAGGAGDASKGKAVVANKDMTEID